MVDPKTNDWRPYLKKKKKEDTLQERSPCDNEAENGGMQL